MSPYHSGGTIPAVPHTVSAAMLSMRLSHGSKLFHPVTPAYTRLRA